MVSRKDPYWAMHCLFYILMIYTIILLKSQFVNYGSQFSGDVSNCSYLLKVLPLKSSRLSSAKKNIYIRNTHEN